MLKGCLIIVILIGTCPYVLLSILHLYYQNTFRYNRIIDHFYLSLYVIVQIRSPTLQNLNHTKSSFHDNHLNM